LCIEPYIYDTASHRDHHAEVQMTGFALPVCSR
jgi:hypothetical protein